MTRAQIGSPGGNLPFGDFTSILINPRNVDEISWAMPIKPVNGGGVYRTVKPARRGADDLKEHRLASQRIWSLAFDSQDQNTLLWALIPRESM